MPSSSPSAASPRSTWPGVMTHFACVTEDPATIDRPTGAIPAGRGAGAPRVAAGRRPRRQQRRHGLRRPHSHLDMVRCGCAVYGLSPWQDDAAGRGPAARPLLEIAGGPRQAGGDPAKASATATPSGRAAPPTWRWCPSATATASSAALGNRGRRAHQRAPLPPGGTGLDGLLRGGRGHRWPGAGGRYVTLIGADGDERITVEEIARRLGTINYEITCDIALDRSERLFLNDDPGAEAAEL